MSRRSPAPAEQMYRLEPMMSGDLSDVLAIERLTCAAPWPRVSFEHELARNPFSFPSVARCRSGGEVAGYCVKWLMFESLHIQNLAVHPAHRSRGLARLLLSTALADGQMANLDEALLEVRASNRNARRLYRSFGFEEVGRRRGYYSRPCEDAVLYRKELG